MIFYAISRSFEKKPDILQAASQQKCEEAKEQMMWYVIQTKTGQEEPMRQRVERMLPEDSFEECKILYYVKKKKYLGEWHEERERLLPGYMFLVTDDPKPAGEALNRITEYTRLLGTGSKFCPIRPEEEELLIRLTNGKDEIGMSYGVIESGILKVRSGVLTGMESRIKKIDRHKRKGFLSMRLDDKEKLVGVGLEITEKS
ncbi:antiterminator LoaP [Schaedlerella arabinosiphila]|uniref:Antiterminator LoaP n=1 Tax=Schaedlerella arabinosiphila TaxID=2044587 RepID=A0A9X5CDN5_9FIRM|nr:antiterminator LoaP [Schaedlerella arabinosiphila]NDO70917.1 antiterminator LoaP [Schaedlerella arabinosiphila]